MGPLHGLQHLAPAILAAVWRRSEPIHGPGRSPFQPCRSRQRRARPCSPWRATAWRRRPAAHPLIGEVLRHLDRRLEAAVEGLAADRLIQRGARGRHQAPAAGNRPRMSGVSLPAGRGRSGSAARSAARCAWRRRSGGAFLVVVRRVLAGSTHCLSAFALPGGRFGLGLSACVASTQPAFTRAAMTSASHSSRERSSPSR